MPKPTEQQIHDAAERISQARAIVIAIRNGAIARHKDPGLGTSLEELANLAWAAEYLLGRAISNLQVSGSATAPVLRLVPPDE